MIAAGWRRLFMGVVLWLTLLAPAWAGDPFAVGPAPADPRQQILVLLRLPPEHFHANSDYADSYGDGAGLAARRRVAARLARTHGLTLVTSWPMPLLGVDCFIMAVPAGRSPEAAAADVAREPGVSSSEAMHVYLAQGQIAERGAADHNDPLFPMQPAAREWRLADLHQIATGKGVRVAVIDSQVEAGHPDLAGQVVLSQDFVLNHPDPAELHGTGVAGIIAGIADNHIGIAGVAPHARLMALRACWQAEATATVCDSLSLAKALHYAIDHNAQVINLSLAGPKDIILSRLLDVALARGITVVGAFDPAQGDGGFPASHPGVIAVTDDPALASAAGAFLAPGRDVPTTQPGGRWFLVNGSSYAAAHVSGLFALLREHEARPGASLTLVSARPGGGAIDACATLLRASGPCACSCSRAPASAVARR